MLVDPLIHRMLERLRLPLQAVMVLNAFFFSCMIRDQRLKENDQILAINDTPLDHNISHQQAIALLQQTTGSLRLVVARDVGHTQGRTSTSSADTSLPEMVGHKLGNIFILNYVVHYNNSW